MEITQKYASLDINNVVLQINKGSGDQISGIRILYKKNDSEIPLYIQCPTMKAPFGANCYKKDETLKAGGTLNYNLCCSLNNDDANIKKFSSFLNALDEKIIEFVVENKALWKMLNIKLRNRKNIQKTPKELRNEIEDNKYSPIVKVRYDSDFPPLMRAKFNRLRKSNALDVTAYIGEKQLDITDDNIEDIFQKSLRVKPVIQVQRIWFINGRFGVSVKLLTTRIYENQFFRPYVIPDTDTEEEPVQKETSIPDNQNETDVSGEKVNSDEKVKSVEKVNSAENEDSSRQDSLQE